MADIRLVSLIPPYLAYRALGTQADFFSILREARRILACGWWPLKARWSTQIA